MPTLIRRSADGLFSAVEEDDGLVAEDASLPEAGLAILPVRRLGEIGDQPAGDRRFGVLVTVDDDLAALIPHLPRLAVIALRFDKYRDGRSYTTAALLRGRHGFTGELRAVGDVLIEEATQMVRCGFDAFAPADDTAAQAWAAKANAHRHVYQTAPDGRRPAYAERASQATPA